MRSALLLMFVAAAALVARSPAVYAEHATIEMTVQRLDPANHAIVDSAVARADQEPPPGGYNPRPLLKAKPGQPLRLEFFLTNNYPHGEVKDVKVRYFVVRADALKQKKTPDPSQGAVTQGSFILNFKPKCRVGARVAFTVQKAGVYIVKLETANTASDHEHMSMLDLLVE